MKLIVIIILCITLAGCATTTTTAPKVDNQQLAKYLSIATSQGLQALAVYEQSKDASTLQAVAYWTQYAAGVADALAKAQ